VPLDRTIAGEEFGIADQQKRRSLAELVLIQRWQDAFD
jgi:hypothetical protein